MQLYTTYNNQYITFNNKMVIHDTGNVNLRYGLVLEYLFENNANETFSHNGTWNGTSAYTTGIIGQSASFNGANTYINTDSYYSQITANRNEFTTCCWFYITIMSNNNTIIGMTNANALNRQDNHVVEIANTGYITVGGEQYGSGYRYLTSAGAVANINTWHMQVSGYNGTQVWYKVYRQGTGLVSSNTLTTSLSVSNTDNMFIGKKPINSNGFNGYIDQLRVWNRTINADEINALWNNGNGY